MSESELIRALRQVFSVYINDVLDEKEGNETMLYYAVAAVRDAAKYEATKPFLIPKEKT